MSPRSKAKQNQGHQRAWSIVDDQLHCPEFVRISDNFRIFCYLEGLHKSRLLDQEPNGAVVRETPAPAGDAQPLKTCAAVSPQGFAPCIENDVAYLHKNIQMLYQSARHRVVITHYAPALEEANHAGLRQSSYRYCFSSNILEQFKSWKGAEQVTHWTLGYTCHNTTLACGNTLV